MTPHGEKKVPLKRILYLGSCQAFLVACARLSAIPAEQGLAAGSLCQAGTSTTPPPLPISPEALQHGQAVGHGPGTKLLRSTTAAAARSREMWPGTGLHEQGAGAGERCGVPPHPWAQAAHPLHTVPQPHPLPVTE